MKLIIEWDDDRITLNSEGKQISTFQIIAALRYALLMEEAKVTHVELERLRAGITPEKAATRLQRGKKAPQKKAGR